MRTITIVRLHGAVLILCSLVGAFGYYFQYHYFQITACIPAAIGTSLLLIAGTGVKDNSAGFMILFLITLVFGIMVTRMSIKFIPQTFQPLRKRVYFPVMAMSSIVTVVMIIKNYRRYKSSQSPASRR